MKAWLVRLAGVFSKKRREREMADELESHLAMHIADNMRAGMTEEEARREAVMKLGGVEPVKEAYRDRGTTPWLEHLILDLRFAVRQLRKNLGFATTAVVVLALGICASVAIFGFVDAALIKPLPYPDPSSLVEATEATQEFPHAWLSYPDYLDFKRLNTSFRSMDVVNGDGYLFRTPNGAEPTRAGTVSGGFFRTLGVRPLLGRDFSPAKKRRARRAK